MNIWETTKGAGDWMDEQNISSKHIIVACW